MLRFNNHCLRVSNNFVRKRCFLYYQEIRKVVQSLEQTAREILTLLQGVHQGAGFQD
ncbi:hypothetical protein FD754_010691, partial [Muntiacus muntjak]